MSSVYQTPTQRPLVPSPSASAQEVHQFLTQFLQALDSFKSAGEAFDQAKALSVDGTALYTLDSNDFQKAFGLHGVIIYRALNESKYGQVNHFHPK